MTHCFNQHCPAELKPLSRTLMKPTQTNSIGALPSTLQKIPVKASVHFINRTTLSYTILNNQQQATFNSAFIIDYLRQQYSSSGYRGHYTQLDTGQWTTGKHETWQKTASDIEAHALGLWPSKTMRRSESKQLCKEKMKRSNGISLLFRDKELDIDHVKYRLDHRPINGKMVNNQSLLSTCKMRG